MGAFSAASNASSLTTAAVLGDSTNAIASAGGSTGTTITTITATTAINGSDSSSPSPSAAAGRSSSFLSRFALPIRSRNRNVVDFHVRPADPHRKYAAGEHVGGAVFLTIVKPVRITHLTVALHGFVRVFKGPNGANEPPFNPADLSTAGASGKSKYFGHGHARLFQDEQVLSADGKLDPGKYEFGFDLMFPIKGLPSSIDFERGTISYVITATLTRPTAITPTQSCDCRIQFKEAVDIGSIAPPRPRTISLEPISKRSRRRKPPATERSSMASEATEQPASDMDSTRATENSTEGSILVDDASQDAQYNPQSPIQVDLRSEVSGDSAASEGTRRSGGGHDPNHPASTNGSHGAPVRTPTVDDRTITATIELQKGGYLPGDIVPVKISVQHIKIIKSLHGVIVTFYRQGRIDSAPPISSFGDLSKEEIRRLEKEEYYPKSKTGLGGLSLTSAGSCSVFRKDLYQTFKPLIIDRESLKSSVTASIRVPEDAFPSIKGVPGDMITFKYQVEVIVDLGGKLASLLQSGQSKGASAAPASFSMNPYETGSGGTQASYAGSIIDTDQLRRQKGVISVAFEVMVGTMDSSRQRGRGVSRPDQPVVITQRMEEAQAHSEYPSFAFSRESAPENHGRLDERPYPYEEEPRHHDQVFQRHIPSQNAQAPVYVPPPHVQDDSGLSEKERLRRAEQILLPSRPTEVSAAGTSAPRVPSGPVHETGESSSLPAAPPVVVVGEPRRETHHAPSAPTLEDLTSSDASAHPREDKNELERRRLLQEASAPPVFPEEFDAGAGAGSSLVAGPSAPPPDTAASSSVTRAPIASLEPSAPVLTEEDDYGPHYAYRSIAGPSRDAPSGPSEPLPKYER